MPYTKLSISAGFTIAINVIVTFFNPYLKKLLIGSEFSAYPLTFQNIMWILFFFSVLELNDYKKLNHLFLKYFKNKYLPEDLESIINEENMGDIFKKSKEDSHKKMGYLPKLIFEIIAQFRINKSVDLAYSTLNNQTDIILNDMELKYSRVKYISWLIPTLGFMGTVLGISMTVSSLNQLNPEDANLIKVMAENLATAFNTTLLALFHSSVIMYLISQIQGKEEEILNRSVEYININLINRLIHKK